MTGLNPAVTRGWYLHEVLDSDVGFEVFGSVRRAGGSQ